MAIFKSNAKLAPLVTELPPYQTALVKISNNHIYISCILPETTRHISVKTNGTYLMRKYCRYCDYLKKSPLECTSTDKSVNNSVNQTTNENEECPGFLELYPTRTNKCLKGINDIDLEVVDIKVPTTLWTICSFDRTYRHYQITTLKTQDGNEIYYKVPYTLANVFSNGAICWGNTNNKHPQDLKKAIQNYWVLPFNSDLMTGYRDEGDLITKLKTFKIPTDETFVASHWEECTTELYRKNYTDVSNKDNYNGVSIWFNPEILSIVPEISKYECNLSLRPGSRQCAVGWFNKLPDGNHLINFGGFKIIKPKLTVTSKPIILGYT